jgi:VanZ family protein
MPPRSNLVRAVYAIVVAYWLLLFLGTHLPPTAGDTPPPADWHLDKLAHCLAFAGLAFLLCTASTISRGFHQSVYIRVLLLVAMYGAFDEWTQRFITGRESDLNDWLADLLGIGIGLSAFSLIGEPLLGMLLRRQYKLGADASLPQSASSQQPNP